MTILSPYSHMVAQLARQFLGCTLVLLFTHGVHAHRSPHIVHSTSSPHALCLHMPSTVQALPASHFMLHGLRGEPPQTRHYNFVISEMEGVPDGVSKPMLVVNGQFPGPTIEANEGDKLAIKVTNCLSVDRTSIHWHGLFQNGTNFYDGTVGVSECGIPPGKSLTYEFDTKGFSGSTWWHSHGTQYTDGVAGALIVHPAAEPPKEFPTWDEDLTVQLTDVYHTLSSTLTSEYLSGTGVLPAIEMETPDSGMINGRGQYNDSGSYSELDLQPNKTYRIRLIHTGSSAQIRFSVDSHPLTIIEADGTLLEPYTVSGLTIAVAQRYSVLLHTNQTTESGNFWMRTRLTSYVPVPGTNTDVRGVIRYGELKGSSLPKAYKDPGFPDTGLFDMNVTYLTPVIVQVPPDRSRFYQVDFGLSTTSTGGAVAVMNGTSWAPLQGTSTLQEIQRTGGKFSPDGSSVELGNQFLVTEDTIETVDILLVNGGAGDHPFHLHGHRPWIMGFGSQPYDGRLLNVNPGNPLRRDTFVVPSNGWIVIRFITDNPGPWTLHCHIAWHMIAGLLMQVNSLPSRSAQFNIPQDIREQCGV